MLNIQLKFETRGTKQGQRRNEDRKEMMTEEMRTENLINLLKFAYNLGKVPKSDVVYINLN